LGASAVGAGWYLVGASGPRTAASKGKEISMAASIRRLFGIFTEYTPKVGFVKLAFLDQDQPTTISCLV
jgi:hypothetical protein